MSRSHCSITDKTAAQTTTNLKLWSRRDVLTAFVPQHLYWLLCVCVDACFSAVDRAWFHGLPTARASTMLHTSRHTWWLTWCLQVKTARIKLSLGGAQTLHIAINFRRQGQKSRSNYPTFIWPIKPTKIHYDVKLHQNLTVSFQVVDNFIIRKKILKQLRSLKFTVKLTEI